ncbi:MAG TPA: enolase C-terminal domain-like protein [Xanthobacteraceae bacterium]|nr:enolase C-terminal domain-like protein [Xanthobacteraceae bacterium]
MTIDTELRTAAPRAGDRPPLVVRRVDAVPVALPLKKPMKMAGVTIAHAHNVLVRIEAQDGTVGWGEAASAPTMTGDTLGGLVAAVRDHLAPLLIGEDAWARPALAAKLRAALIGNTGAHSAVEMALLDLTGRAANVPLIDLVGGAVRPGVAPMWLIGNKTTEEDIAEAHEREGKGFHFFKLKVGVKSLAAEIDGTRALRAALGPAVPLCADANCGFTPEAARRYLDGVRDANLLFLEQPLGPADLDGFAALARTSPVPLGVDEGIHSLADIEAHARCGAGGVSLKLIKLGGIGPALAAADLCRRLGLKVNVAVKIAESSIGSAAAVHLACAIPASDWGVSLTHFYLAEDLVRHPLPLGDGLVALPTGPGLGVEVDEAAVERFRV